MHFRFIILYIEAIFMVKSINQKLIICFLYILYGLLSQLFRARESDGRQMDICVYNGS